MDIKETKAAGCSAAFAASEKTQIRVSARAMAEAVHVGGDLFAAGAFEVLNDAAQAHRDWQREQKQTEYRAEVSVSTDIESEHFCFHVTGRIDGLIQNDQGVTVQEIKTVGQDAPLVLESANPAYWAQAIAYGYMLCRLENLPGLTVQLLYLGRQDGSRQAYNRPMTAKQLEQAFFQTANVYMDAREREWARRRQLCDSVEKLGFPFPAYREGQRTMMKYAYLAALDGRRVFVQAPTGTGKTAAALYPAIQALRQGAISRVFYLTAQGTNAAAALGLMQKLCGAGLDARVCRIRAKDDVCPMPVRSCSDACPYANGYFDRAPKAVEALLDRGGVFDAPEILEAAMQAQVCPHEFTLDLSLGCEVIVGDYNYAFDPRAGLKRYFTNGGDYQLLVDEAHALPDRARAMFGAQVSFAGFAALRRQLGVSGRRSAFYRATAKAARALAQIEKDEAFLSGENMDEPALDVLPAQDADAPPNKEAPENHSTRLPRRVACAQMPQTVLEALTNWHSEAQAHLPQAGALLRELFFETQHFLSMCRLAQRQPEGAPRHQFLITRGKTCAKVELLCLDASAYLRQVLDKCRSALFFSATFSPVEYYKRLCGGQESDAHALLPSPYDPGRLCVLHLPVRVSYQYRAQALCTVTQALYQMVCAKSGHYMAFFPSYAYLNQAFEAFTARYPQIPVRKTDPDESAQTRAALIDTLQCRTDGPLLVFAVLGGVFAQSVDLPGDALIGCAIVTVGLPRLDPSTRLLRAYFDQSGQNGFDCALRYPGLCRAIQAAGRVIRCESDRGVVLLIDQRYGQPDYASLLPPHWRVTPVNGPENLSAQLDNFWRKTV